MEYYTVYLTIELIECRLQNKIEEQSIEWEGSRTGPAIESILTTHSVIVYEITSCILQHKRAVLKYMDTLTRAKQYLPLTPPTSRNLLLKNGLLSPDGILAWKHI
ncbi:uncharacterized protein LOC144432177 [Styela clava]